MKRLRFHGSKDKVVFDEVGYNSRLDDLQAAIIRVFYPHLDGWNAARAQAAAWYAEEGLGEVMTLPGVADGATHIYHLYMARHPRRDDVRAALSEAGVASAVYYGIPMHLQPVFAPLGYPEGDLPVAEECGPHRPRAADAPQPEPRRRAAGRRRRPDRRRGGRSPLALRRPVGGEQGRRGALHVLRARPEARDRQADRRDAAPDGAARVAGALRLDGGEHRAGVAVVVGAAGVGEAHDRLVELLVEHLGAALGEARRQRARPSRSSAPPARPRRRARAWRRAAHTGTARARRDSSGL